MILQTSVCMRVPAISLISSTGCCSIQILNVTLISIPLPSLQHHSPSPIWPSIGLTFIIPQKTPLFLHRPMSYISLAKNTTMHTHGSSSWGKNSTLRWVTNPACIHLSIPNGWYTPIGIAYENTLVSPPSRICQFGTCPNLLNHHHGSWCSLSLVTPRLPFGKALLSYGYGDMK